MALTLLPSVPPYCQNSDFRVLSAGTYFFSPFMSIMSWTQNTISQGQGTLPAECNLYKCPLSQNSYEYHSRRYLELRQEPQKQFASWVDAPAPTETLCWIQLYGLSSTTLHWWKQNCFPSASYDLLTNNKATQVDGYSKKEIIPAPSFISGKVEEYHLIAPGLCYQPKSLSQEMVTNRSLLL